MPHTKTTQHTIPLSDLTYKQREDIEKMQIDLLRTTLEENGINPDEDFLNSPGEEDTGKSSGRMGFPTRKIGTKEIMDFISDDPELRSSARDKINSLPEKELINYHSFLKEKGMPVEYDVFKSIFYRQQAPRGGKRKTKKRIYGKGKDKKADEKACKSYSKSSKPSKPRLTKSPTIYNLNNLTQDDNSLNSRKIAKGTLRRSNSDPIMSKKVETDSSSSDDEVANINEMMDLEEALGQMGMDKASKGGKRRRRRRTLKKKKSKRKSRKYRKRINPMDIAE